MCTCMGDCGCVHAYNCGWVVLHFFEEWYGIRKNTSVSHLETWVGYALLKIGCNPITFRGVLTAV